MRAPGKVDAAAAELSEERPVGRLADREVKLDRRYDLTHLTMCVCYGAQHIHNKLHLSKVQTN